MISAFHDFGGLFDIDRVKFRDTQSRVKKMGIWNFDSQLIRVRTYAILLDQKTKHPILMDQKNS